MQIDLKPLDLAHVRPLRELHQQPGVTRWWGPMETDFPFDEAESTRYAIVADSEVVGLIQYGEENEPDYRHAWVDIFIGDDNAGRGIGTEALRQMIRILVEERGHHRITIDPAADNEAAIRSYEKAGFRSVGTQSRAYLQTATGDWRDELLMERVE